MPHLLDGNFRVCSPLPGTEWHGKLSVIGRGACAGLAGATCRTYGSVILVWRRSAPRSMACLRLRVDAEPSLGLVGCSQAPRALARVPALFLAYLGILGRVSLCRVILSRRRAAQKRGLGFVYDGRLQFLLPPWRKEGWWQGPSNMALGRRTGKAWGRLTGRGPRGALHFLWILLVLQLVTLPTFKNN